MTKQLVLLFLFGWLFSACSKKADQLGSEYQSLVGKWEIINPNANRVRITFKSNGKVFIENGPDRGIKYKVSEMVELSEPVNPNPDIWHTFLLKTNGRELIVEKQEGFVDTIYTYAGPVLVDTVGINSSFYFHRIKN
ncbi:MAG TPA: hypothetical protein VK151_09270 [Fluviicola sp.]|nr:hypothetical protein [Fluviicola sp.]